MSFQIIEGTDKRGSTVLPYIAIIHIVIFKQSALYPTDA